MLVDTLDQDLGLVGGFGHDASRQFVVDRVREAQRKVQHLAIGLGFVTHADKLQLTLEALADTDNHVVNQSASSTGHGAVLLVAITSGETQFATFLDHLHGRVNVKFQSALGTLDRELLTGEFDLDTGRQHNGVLSNARHAYPPVSYTHLTLPTKA